MNILLVIRNVLAFYVAYLGIVAVHELGHWAVGRCFGFTTKELRVGFIRWTPDVKVTFDARLRSFLSGIVVAYPTQLGSVLRITWPAVLLAGPLANIGCGAILMLATEDHSPGTFIGTARWFAAGSLLVGLINLLPMTSGKHGSDGAKLFESMFSHGVDRLRFEAHYLLTCSDLASAMKSQNWQQTKTLCESILEFGEHAPDTHPMKEATVVALSLSQRFLGIHSAIESNPN